MFEENIKNWVSLDNEIKIIQEKIKILREKKLNLSENINHYVITNKLENVTIQISDGKLKFGKTHTSQPLTFKFLEESLSEIISNKEQVNTIITHIKNKRTTKTTQDIKRYYSDN